jgi:hypothetical protein
LRTIVSLTSTAGRLAVLRYTLLSLIEQRISCDGIALNLSHEPYLQDEGVEVLPDWLRELRDRDLVEIRWTENTGPYRKLLPTLLECDAEDVVVTCDDDVIYGERWLEKLLDHARLHPDAVVCGQARVPARNVVGRLQSYIHWPAVTSDGDYPMLIPIGVAGVVYRKSLLDYGFLTWREFTKVAPKQDDLWFRKASERLGTTIRIAPEAYAHVHPIKTGQTLSDTNVAGRFRSEWPDFVRPLLERAAYRLKAYAGLPVCENDRVWRAVNEASERFDRTEGDNSSA